MALVTYADLAAMSPKGGTYAQRSVVRMEDSGSPMPPAGKIDISQVNEFASWVGQGMPMGDCENNNSSSSSGGTTTSSGAGGAPPQTGVPCDVAAALKPCLGCHGSPPGQGVPMSLATYAQLTKASPKGGTYATRSITRMQDGANPMPPPPDAMASNADIQTVQNWVNAGYPMGDCNQGTGGGGAGGGDPYGTPDTCSRGAYWPNGSPNSGYETTSEDSRMNPGEACYKCHNKGGSEAPSLQFGGTVYQTAHEFDFCYGIAGNGMTVEVTDANGKVVTAKVGSLGNFYKKGSPGSLAFPLHARVIDANNNVRQMVKGVNTGDCNSCHSLHGDNNAPGRVMAP
jgi:hypothetical protein